MTIFAALLRKIPTGCKDAVLRGSLLKNHTLIALLTSRTPKNHTKTIFASSEHLISTCMEMRDLRKKHQSCSISFLLAVQILTLQGVCMDNIPSVEDIVGINIFIYDIDLIDGAMVGELTRRSIKKYEKSVQLIRYNSHICYVDNIHALTLQGFPLSNLRYIFPEDWKLGASLGQLQ